MSIATLFDGLSRVAEPLVRPVTKRLNPILVKEVRQSLRGNYFQWSFSVVTLIATMSGCVMLYNLSQWPDARGGMNFFITIFAILSAAVNVLVPFQAFLSVGSEWEENTYDLLVLSELSPLQIAKGKLLSSLVQSLIYYTAFAPFLVFAFLLRGLDLGAGAWVLGTCLVYSCTLSALAICLSSLVVQKFSRVLLMALLVALLVAGCMGSVGFSYMVIEERLSQNTEFLQAMGSAQTLALVLTAFLTLLAATRFTHPEENRSTGLRVMVTLMTLIGVGWMSYFYLSFPGGDVLPVCATMAFVALTVFGMLFCAEPESLGRRVALGVPRSNWRLLLAAPFLPGGARGVLHYLLNLSIVTGAVILLPFVKGDPGGFFGMRSSNVPMGLLPYLVSYLLLPTALFARFSGNLRNRIRVRLAVPVLMIFSIMLPTVAIFVGTGGSNAMDHVANPFYMIDEAVPGPYGALWLAAFFATLVAAGNIPRVVASFGELGRARQRRLARDAKPMGRIPDLPDDGGAGADARA